MNLSTERAQYPAGDRIGAHVLGHDPTQREGIKRLLSRVMVHLVCLLLLTLAGLHGHAAPERVALVLAYVCSGWVTFYGLIRSGWSARCHDASLDGALALFAVSAIVLAYGLLDVVRDATLQLLCLALVMHVDRLSVRQVMWATIGSMVVLTAIVTGLWWFAPWQIDPRIEFYNLVLALMMLPISAFLTNETRRVFARATQHSSTLADTLDKLRQQSPLDELTGLINQRHMMAVLEGEIKRRQRTGQTFSVALLSIQISGDLHQVNPPLARSTIDTVLREVATRAPGQLGGADRLARWSDDCLLLLMPAMPLAQALDSTDKLRHAVLQHDGSPLGSALSVALSAGVAEHHFTDTLGTLLDRAAEALRRAQQNGHNRIATEPELAAGTAAQPKPARDQARVAPRLHLTLPTTQLALASAPAARSQRPVMRVAANAAASPARTGDGDWPDWLKLGVRAATNALMSTDPAIRERLRLPLTGALVYVAWITTMLGYAVPSGLMTAEFSRWLTAYDLVGMLGFYPLLRSGWSARWIDTQLIMPQMIYGCGACALCYAAAPDLRPIALQMLCFIQLFGMAALLPWQTRVVGTSSVLMQFGALAWVWGTRADHLDIGHEALSIVTASLIIAYISVQSWRFSLLRERVRSEQGVLGKALARASSQQIHDALTGLHSQQHLSEQLNLEVARSQRCGQGFCVALLALDQLAQVNERQGHATGASLLIQFGRTAASVLRQTDVLGHWGQQTLLVLLPDTDNGPQAVLGIERLRQLVARQPAWADVPGLRITLSCGIAESRPAEPIARLLERAEHALYTAKASGGNRSVLAD